MARRIALGSGHRRELVASAYATGFTLIELLVVMAIIATLLSIAAPRYFDSLERAKEAALRSDLRVLREAIDHYRGDAGRLPESLTVLVAQRYLRNIPIDPFTEHDDDWVAAPHPDAQTPGIYDVHSAASGVARNGTKLSSW